MKPSLLPPNEPQLLKFLEAIYEKALEKSDLSSIDTLPKTAPSELLLELGRNFDMEIAGLSQ
ncbi:hypothetical protein, partial [Helicobacter japonicus]|uniref:hypothetical protein n=1 Tax=Helicobacter japonicus TaxID=425400 RepID=UPI002594ABE1